MKDRRRHRELDYPGPRGERRLLILAIIIGVIGVLCAIKAILT